MFFFCFFFWEIHYFSMFKYFFFFSFGCYLRGFFFGVVFF